MASKSWSNFKKPPTAWKNLSPHHKEWITTGVKVAGVTAGCGVLGACALPALGFGSAGVAAGSLAASWQGPAVAAGSVFATCQSLGATGVGAWVLGTAGAATGAGFCAVVHKYRK